ncbi:hypothetical protein Vadar_012329 [Vaccinium darrowii]|nr:hypothetical protein Vadar_012329 [Vaccinium darrowii]
MALRWKTGGDPKGTAKAVMINGLERGATFRARVGVSCTRQHKGCTHIDVAQLGRASLGLLGHHYWWPVGLLALGLHHNQPDEREKQHGAGNERDKGFGDCHDSKFFCF